MSWHWEDAHHGEGPADGLMDPVEASRAQAERYEEEQDGVPCGSFRCHACHEVFDYEPITRNDPASPVWCVPCSGVPVDFPGV